MRLGFYLIVIMSSISQLTLADTKSLNIQDKSFWYSFGERLANCVGYQDLSVFSYFQKQFEESLEQDGMDIGILYDSLRSCHKKTPSTGRSGASFIKTEDGRFILKSISVQEFRNFKKIAADYFHYVRRNPYTLLVPLYGLFKIGRNNVTRLLVMPNLVPKKTESTLCYDLKGRKVRSKSRNTTVVDDDGFPEAPSFGLSQFDLLRLRSDLQFLKMEGLMDYSLFVVRDLSSLRINIIDFLTEFDWKKELEGIVTSAIWTQEQRSAISPEEYELRMRAFLLNLLIDNELRCESNY